MPFHGLPIIFTHMNMNSTSTPALDQCFRALSDRARLRLLFLLEGGECCVGDLVAALDLPQANVSRHLAYLQRAGLVASRPRGLWRFYRLAEEPSAQAVLGALFTLRGQMPEAAADREGMAQLRDAGLACCPDLTKGSCA